MLAIAGCFERPREFDWPCLWPRVMPRVCRLCVDLIRNFLFSRPASDSKMMSFTRYFPHVGHALSLAKDSLHDGSLAVAKLSSRRAPTRRLKTAPGGCRCLGQP